MRSAFADILVPGAPGFYVAGPQDPEIIFIFFHILDFKSIGSYQIASIFDMLI